MGRICHVSDEIFFFFLMSALRDAVVELYFYVLNQRCTSIISCSVIYITFNVCNTYFVEDSALSLSTLAVG
jgi:hypothetical protein